MHASVTFLYNETVLSMCTFMNVSTLLYCNEEIAFAKVNGRLIE